MNNENKFNQFISIIDKKIKKKSKQYKNRKLKLKENFNEIQRLYGALILMKNLSNDYDLVCKSHHQQQISSFDFISDINKNIYKKIINKNSDSSTSTMESTSS